MPAKSQKQVIKELTRLMPKQLDLMDRLRAYYFAGAELSVPDKETLSNMRKMWAIYCANTSKLQTAAIFSKETGLSESQCFYILRQSMELFGDVGEVDKRAERIAATEWYLNLANKAKERDELEVAMKCRERADKLQGLYEQDKQAIPLDKLLPAVNVTLISDPDILRAQQLGEELIDITYESAETVRNEETD